MLESFGLSDADVGHMMISLWAATHGFVSLELRHALPRTIDADAAFEQLVSQLLAAIETAAPEPTSSTATRRSGRRADQRPWAAARGVVGPTRVVLTVQHRRHVARLLATR